MSRSPFDPRELDGGAEGLDDVGRRLDEYVRETAGNDPSPLLAARIMSAIPEDEPRRGLLGVLGGGLRALRAAPLALLLLLLVGFGGVLAVGQVTGAFRILPVSTPDPTPPPLVIPTEAVPGGSLEPSTKPDPTPETSPTPSTSPSPSRSPFESAPPSASPSPAAGVTATPSAKPSQALAPTIAP